MPLGGPLGSRGHFGLRLGSGLRGGGLGHRHQGLEQPEVVAVFGIPLHAKAPAVPAAHHQAINRMGSGLLAVGWTLDQVVEGIELQGHRWGLGVQWNPEDGDDTGCSRPW